MLYAPPKLCPFHHKYVFSVTVQIGLADNKLLLMRAILCDHFIVLKHLEPLNKHIIIHTSSALYYFISQAPKHITPILMLVVVFGCIATAAAVTVSLVITRIEVIEGFQSGHHCSLV